MEIGYILDVDIDYPDTLHNEHNDFPLLPETMKPPVSKTKKLLTTFPNKRNYVIHYRNLKQVLAFGLKLRRINRVLKFKQSDWLKPYITLNTKLRQTAANEFEKAFYKLMINAIFGKTMKNVFKRMLVKFVKNWENEMKRQGARSLISKPNFHSCKIFNENLCAVQLNPTKVYCNKPLFVGFAILEIPKRLIYDFYYNFIKTIYPNNASKLLYIDTDSLTIHCYDKSIFDVILNNPTLSDTSNFEKGNIKQQNKAQLGLFKDEYGGRVMQKFIGLKSKCSEE